MSNLNRALRLALSATVAMSILANAANAQSVPQVPSGGAASVVSQSTSQEAASAAYVTLAERTAPCRSNATYCIEPRPARPSTIDGTSPTVTPTEWMRDYPRSGMAGYNRIARANQALCSTADEYVAGLRTLDQLFVSAGNEYQLIQDVYNDLPDAIRRNARVMIATQAVQAGLLCLLSFGTYCIAVVVGAAGNIMTTHTNERIQLTSVQLALANIVVTKLNIWSNRLTIRLDNLWLKDWLPNCEGLGYHINFTLPPLGPPPSVPEGFGQPALPAGHH